MRQEDILQRCLEDTAAGRKTPAACAAEFPQVPDLLGQLLAAQALVDWPAPALSAAATRQHQAQLRNLLLANQRRSRQLARALLPRWALSLALVVTLVLGGVGTAGAAAGSLPGQGLYAVKRGAESFQAFWVPASQQAAWQTHLARTRTNELMALAAQGTVEAVVLARLTDEIGLALQTALGQFANADHGAQALLLVELLSEIERERNVLALVSNTAPQASLDSLDQALLVTEAQRADALLQLDSVSSLPDGAAPGAQATRTPSWTSTFVPPGQAKQTATATPVAPSPLPPGQAKKTETEAPAAATDLPPGQANKTATPMREDTQVPPGLAAHTATAAVHATAGMTPTSPGQSGDPNHGPQPTPNCQAINPNSSNYCTPIPTAPGNGLAGSHEPSATDAPPLTSPTATACPLNPAGNPACTNRP